MDKKQLSRGQISLSWLNKYSCILFRSRYTSILIDPVNIDPSLFDKLDAILITQDTFDHLDEDLVNEIQSKTNCTVIADSVSSNKLIQIPEEKLKVAHVRDEFQIDDCRIYVERSATSSISPLTYIIISEEGVSVYHTSDSMPFKEMSIIGEKYKIDACFCAVGFASKVSPKTGFEIVKLIKPKLALPYHGEKLKEFVNLVSRKIPNVKSKVLKINEEIVYP
ncbi:MAG: MBL fold metallo-hydrolase [Candidatus Bathyarchaeia archaeon]